LLHDYEKRSRTTLHFTYNINEKELKNAHSIGLYRIVQESLNNIAKHANANNIYINFEKVQDKLVLTIRDDGSGFDKNQNKKEKSFGLLGIQERVIMMNGLYEINSEINKGTEIIVKIPLENLKELNYFRLCFEYSLPTTMQYYAEELYK
jgi:two-component system sensor histidine kinase DegS